MLTEGIGHEWIMRNQENFGELEMKWIQEYGAVFRIGGCFGVSALYQLFMKFHPPFVYSKTY